MKTTLLRLLSLVALLAVCFAVPPLEARADVLKDYQKRYKKGFLSDREDVISELAELGSTKAVKAIRWCIDHTKKVLVKAEKDAEKAYKRYVPVRDELVEKEMKWASKFKEKGKKVPKKRPKWPVDDEYLQVKSETEEADRLVKREKDFLRKALAAHGKIVAQLPPADQEKIKAEWQKQVGAKGWGERAAVYELLGGTKSDWAYQMLVDATKSEADPRALIVVIDGLGGREAAKVLPILDHALQDTRWLVRAAAIEALERTPSKESIDLLVDTLGVEQGRLKDDCVRALRTLTGHDGRADHDLWKRYWADNREQWNGPPEPEPDEEDEDPEKEWERQLAKSEDRKTGFFGIETNSRRLVYVIDISGSMNEKAGEKGDASRADKAKDELVRAVRALEDGAAFNILFFAAGVVPWQEGMVDASSETRRSAEEFVTKMAVGGGTNSHDAFDRAFALADKIKGKKRLEDGSGDAKVDTIIFLSDGKPSVGRITAPDALRAQIRDWNKTRRITIHSVAFGKDADLEFMKGLAGDSGGTFLAK